MRAWNLNATLPMPLLIEALTSVLTRDGRNRFREEQLEAVMMLQIHDELLFECPPSELDAVKAIVKDRMEHAMKLDVPLVVDIGHGASWAEAKE